MMKFLKWNLKYQKNQKKKAFKNIEVDFLENLINQNKEAYPNIMAKTLLKEDLKKPE